MLAIQGERRLSSAVAFEETPDGKLWIGLIFDGDERDHDAYERTHAAQVAP
jgi:hypothetical protein